MRIIFAGVGSAFTTQDYYQSNLVIQKNNKNFLIDCGSDIRFSLKEIGLTATDINALFITHAHADHIGGMEWLAFSTYFVPSAPRPILYGMRNMLPDFWNKSLSGGLESVQCKINTLEDYFELKQLNPNDIFYWENIEFIPVQTCHVMNGFKLMDSYGLLIKDLDSKEKKTIFFTGDTQFAPNQLVDFYNEADLIFHDCETSPFKSGVHAHFEELSELPTEIKNKMYLYHYQPGELRQRIFDFKGFVKKGQEFNL